MDISIIIPNYNQADALKHSLTAIDSLNYPEDWNVETLIVDNESTDNSIELISEFTCQIITNKGKKNPYISRNLGIKNTRSDIVAFLDAKSIPRSDWLKNGVENLMLSSNQIICGQFKIEFSQNPELEEIAYSVMYLDNEYSNKLEGTYPGQNFFVSRKNLNKVGPFNEHRSGSDNEWFQRAKELDIDIKYSPEVCVTHKAKTKREFYSAIKRFGQGARKNWIPNKGKIKTNLIACTYLFPMSFHVFRDKLGRRGILLNKMKALKVWLIIWKARAIFALNMLGFK